MGNDLSTSDAEVTRLREALVNASTEMARLAGALRRWKRVAVLLICGIITLGLGWTRELKPLRAQSAEFYAPPAAAPAALPPSGSVVPPQSSFPQLPVKVARYYIHLPLVAYAYYAKDELVVYSSGAPAFTLSLDEAKQLSEYFPRLDQFQKPTSLAPDIAPRPFPTAPVAAPGAFPTAPAVPGNPSPGPPAAYQ